MNADCSIHTGSTHPICQDYARTGIDKAGNPYAIIADGCSSSPETDIGARLLVMAAENNLALLPNSGSGEMSYFYHSTLELAAYWARGMKLPLNCLDATLGILSIADNTILSSLYGDGLIVFGYDQTLEVDEISFSSNYPVYPSYLLMPERLKSMPKDNTMNRHSSHFSKNNKKWNDLSRSLMLANEKVPFLKYRDKSSTLNFVALITDGAKSFLAPSTSSTSKTTEPVGYEQIIPDLVGFKNFTSGFVKRRVNKFEQESKKNGWQHYDDLTVAAIAFDSEKA